MIRTFKQLGGAWDRFWFEPQSTASLGLFRIAFGLIAICQLAPLSPNLLAFFGPSGVIPRMRPGEWSIIALANTDAAVIIVFVLTLLGAVAVTVGWHSRIAAIVLAIGVHSLVARNPAIWSTGDLVFRTLTLFLALAPSGAALSLDRMRTARDRFWEFPARAPWALRLIQIQLSVAYIASVVHKLRTDEWRDGTAVSYALRMDDVARWPTPDWISQSDTISQILTWTTLEAEIALGILVWVRVARPFVLGMGVLLHLGMHYAVSFGMFSFIMITMYLTFISPYTAERVVLAARSRICRLRVARDERSRIRPATRPDEPALPADGA